VVSGGTKTLAVAVVAEDRSVGLVAGGRRLRVSVRRQREERRKQEQDQKRG